MGKHALRGVISFFTAFFSSIPGYKYHLCLTKDICRLQPDRVFCRIWFDRMCALDIFHKMYFVPLQILPVTFIKILFSLGAKLVFELVCPSLTHFFHLHLLWNITKRIYMIQNIYNNFGTLYSVYLKYRLIILRHCCIVFLSFFCPSEFCLHICFSVCLIPYFSSISLKWKV